MRYATLHNHSIYSIKDAIASPTDYVNGIHEYNASSSEHEIIGVALTEHSNMFSAVKLSIACNTPREINGVERTTKAIFGNEIYHCDSYDLKSKGNERHHLVVLAKNEIGLTNIYNLTSECGLNKYKGSSKDYQICLTSDLSKYGEGIICLSACVGGKLGKLVKEGALKEAEEFALYLNSSFEEFYLEIQPHDLPEQKLLNDFILKLNEKHGIPMVITSDSHYVLKEDRKYHDIMKEIDALSRKMKDVNALKFTTQNHMWTPDELIEWCNQNGFPLEIIENTAKIADKCNVDIKPSDPRGLMPEFPCPKGYTDDAYLKKLTAEGLERKVFKNLSKKSHTIQQYVKRLNYELDVITQLGFSSYFLILWDWFLHCRKKGIPLGPGRGSAAGSLVSYLLNITKVDPVEHNLIMERFLNLERVEFPDIDTDVSKVDRREALLYLMDKYGEDYVCQIVTFNRYGLKNTIRALLSSSRGFTADYQNSITNAMPFSIGGGDFSVTYDVIEDIVNNPDKYLVDEKISKKDYKDVCNAYNVLQEVFVKYPEVELALKKLRQAVASTGIHAGGVIISSKVIKNHIPLMKGSDTAVMPVCQADMDDLHYFNAL